MPSENFVSYTIMNMLRKNDWRILQYHPPGGQAGWGVIVQGRSMYLDIIAYSNAQIVLAENKNRFNQGDIDKLEKIMNDPEAVLLIKEFVRTRCAVSGIECEKELHLAGVHGYAGGGNYSSLPNINLIHVSREGTITLRPSLLNPLVIQ